MHFWNPVYYWQVLHMLAKLILCLERYNLCSVIILSLVLLFINICVIIFPGLINDNQDLVLLEQLRHRNVYR